MPGAPDRTAAIKMAKAIGCTVITTVGDDAKAEKARALGADHVINYRADRFEHVVRKITAKKGVDVVFEHTGPRPQTAPCCAQARRAAGHMRGHVGALDHVQSDAAVPAASTRFSARSAPPIENIRTVLAKMAGGLLPVIDTEVALPDFERGSRASKPQVFARSS